MTDEPKKVLSLRFDEDDSGLSVSVYADGDVLIKDSAECVVVTFRQLETIVTAVRNCVNPA